MLKRLERLPVAILPTFVGTLTLSNVYGSLGFTWLRYLIMAVATVMILAYIVKIITCPATCRKEYDQTVPASLYAGFTMCLMILGSFYYEIGLGFGKWLWLVAVVIHSAHILLFTWRNVISRRNIQTTVPSWFVTYNGIMVSCVTGGAMGMPLLLRCITIYGIAAYLILIPVMIFRLMRYEVKPAVYHTMPVVLAPCSLCVVSLCNAWPEPNAALLLFLYGCVLASLLFIVIKLPDFFSFPFAPGFAGLTFPMAIGIVASTKVAAFCKAREMAFGTFCTQLSGLQILLTSMLVGYVLLNFTRMLLRTKNRTY